MVKKSAKFSASVKCHARPSSMWDTETEYGDSVTLDFLCSIQKGKKRPRQRVTGKFCGRRDSSLRCSRSNQRFPASDHPPHVILPPLPRWIPRPTIARSILARDRSDVTLAENSGRARQRLITISVSRDLSLLSKTTSSSRITLFSRRSLPSPLPSPSSSSSSSPFTSLFVVLLYYFTLAHTLNFAYCCRRWRSLKTIITFVLFQRIRDGDDSPHVALSLRLFEF